MKDKLTKTVHSRNITIGGDSIISVQTMLKRSFNSYSSEYIQSLKYYGTDILRFSIDGNYDKNELSTFIKTSPLPLVLDVKADKQQALDSLKSGIDAVRINPILLTNSHIEEIIRMAKDVNAIVRIGTNEGSTKGQDAVSTILNTIEMCEKLGFTNIVTSVKASNAESTILLNTQLSNKTEYPIHIGLTEAGDSITSAVRSTIVMSKLLNNGIGDTIRYSMAGSEKSEVIAGNELLSSLGLREPKLHLVICPSCSRATFLTGDFINSVMDDLYKVTYIKNKSFTLAIMGCPLNGIGEAKDADIGISGTSDEVILFNKGHIIDRVKPNDAKEILIKRIMEYV